ncbi:2'-5' RNA ligase family protein [Hymenobacter koreensis]|uniref:2'-5' RNA ligase family protein n=1 Tax=Hymenobacter koreensis TaxID=1084523 RepID=A0ABP8IYH1_9BACT
MQSPETPPLTAPLILTLTLNAEAQAYFDALRRQHFPPERNYLDAHLTLFHHLPGDQLPALSHQLTELCQAQPPLLLQVNGLLFMGQGVAYKLESAALENMHRMLQQSWWPLLTPQDQQRRRPHVTVQNKVRPEVARTLHQQLTETFLPFEAQGIGLRLWAYRGGPWELLRTFSFQG